MAIDDLPGPVVNLLNVIGVPWPYVDEQSVSELAKVTRQFAQAVETTHQDGTKAVSGVAAAYRSAASDAMLNGWEKLSSRHVSEIHEGCQVLAGALDLAADYIVVQKGAAIAALLEMAVEVGGDIVAGVFTGGLADALLPEIELAANKAVQSLIMDLQQYLLSKVIEAGLKPLMSKVENALSGLDWPQSGADTTTKGTGLELDTPEALMHSQALDQYADEMRSHAQTFAASIRKIQF